MRQKEPSQVSGVARIFYVIAIKESKRRLRCEGRSELLSDAAKPNQGWRGQGQSKHEGGLEPSAPSLSPQQSKALDVWWRQDRTKEKRKRDQSASFLGGRWKTEEEMHMRDHFDSLSQPREPDSFGLSLKAHRPTKLTS